MARNRVIKAARSAEEIVAKARARPSLSEVEAMQLAADDARSQAAVDANNFHPG